MARIASQPRQLLAAGSSVAHPSPARAAVIVLTVFGVVAAGCATSPDRPEPVWDIGPGLEIEVDLQGPGEEDSTTVLVAFWDAVIPGDVPFYGGTKALAYSLYEGNRSANYVLSDGALLDINRGEDDAGLVVSVTRSPTIGWGIGIPARIAEANAEGRTEFDVVSRADPLMGRRASVSYSESGADTEESVVYSSDPSTPKAEPSWLLGAFSPYGRFTYPHESVLPASGQVWYWSRLSDEDVSTIEILGTRLLQPAVTAWTPSPHNPRMGPMMPWGKSPWSGVLSLEAPTFHSSSQDYFEYAAEASPEVQEFLHEHPTAWVCKFSWLNQGQLQQNLGPQKVPIMERYTFDFQLCSPAGEGLSASVRMDRSLLVEPERREFSMQGNERVPMTEDLKSPASSSLVPIQDLFLRQSEALDDYGGFVEEINFHQANGGFWFMTAAGPTRENTTSFDFYWKNYAMHDMISGDLVLSSVRPME